MVALLVTILLGAFVGWVASIVMNRDAQQGALTNILVGIGGAVVGSLFASLLDGTPGVDPFITFAFWDLFWAFVGALVVLAVLNYSQRKQIR